MNNFLIRLRSLPALCLAVFFLLAPPSAAFGLNLAIRNDFADSLNTAVVYCSDSTGKWTTKGWYVVGAGKSRTINFPTSKSTIYIYSYLSGKKPLGEKGDISRMVISKAFMYEDGKTCPAGPDRRTEKFTKYVSKNNLVNYRPVKTGDPLPAGGSNPFPPARIELLKLINADRKKAGAGVLKLDAALTKAAARRASEQPEAWGHTRPNGKSYSSVFAEFNLNPVRSGENVALNTKSLKASYFHEQFMNSPGHKRNLLNPDYSAVGLGFHKEGGRIYCVELFTGGGGGAGNKPAPGEDGLADVAAGVVNLINHERTRSGLVPLGTSGSLSNAALTRAREMNVKFDISIRPDGRSFDTVLKDNGLDFARATSSGADTPKANRFEIFQEFYTDEKTRNPMLAREYSHVGAGISRHGDGYYTVLLFTDGSGERGTPETGLGGVVRDLEKALTGWEYLERAIEQFREVF